MARTPTPAFVTLKQAAQILDCPYHAVLRAIQNGELPVVRLGSRYRIPKSALVARPVEQAS